jgi:integrase
MVPANPAARLEKYPEPPGRERTLTDQELGALFKALDECDVVSARILRLLACSGLRKNEVCSLQTRFVDLERRSLFLPTTKSGKPRQVPLNDMAVRLLRDQLQHANGSPWLFPAANGKGPRRDVRGTFARACALANISGFHIHDLRHVFASLAVSANCSLPVVARLLGHSRTSAITDRYSHVADATLRAASNTVAEHIAGVISKKQDP